MAGFSEVVQLLPLATSYLLLDMLFVYCFSFTPYDHQKVYCANSPE